MKSNEQELLHGTDFIYKDLVIKTELIDTSENILSVAAPNEHLYSDTIHTVMMQPVDSLQLSAAVVPFHKNIKNINTVISLRYANECSVL